MTDTGFKTALFGGFDKNNVLKYIEIQKNEEAEKIAALNERIAELENREDKTLFVSELYNRIEQIENENRAYLAKLKEKIGSLENENNELVAGLTRLRNEKDAVIAKLEEENTYLKSRPTGIADEGFESAKVKELEEEIARLSATNKAYLEEMSVLSERAKQSENVSANTEELDNLLNQNAELNTKNAEYNKQIEELKQQVEELKQQSESESNRDITTRLGSTMAKAQMFADELIKEARDEAKAINNATVFDLSEVNATLEEIEDEVSEFRNNINTQIDDIVQNLNKISGKITSTAINISKK